MLPSTLRPCQGESKAPWRLKRTSRHDSTMGLKRSLNSGATAPVSGTFCAKRQPHTETTSTTTDTCTAGMPSEATSAPPTRVPSKMAVNMPISIRPLPPTSS